jgi:hypothetical protein
MISTSARGWLLLITCFAAGLVAGYASGRPHGVRPSRADNPMEPHIFVERLSSDLHLDAPQRDSITAILTRRQRVIDSAWRALEPGVRATIDSAQREIAAVLRPDQRAKYLELFRAAHGNMGGP